jgi:hypothetical protein
MKFQDNTLLSKSWDEKTPHICNAGEVHYLTENKISLEIPVYSIG